MTANSLRLGYFIRDYNSKDTGFSATSLAALVHEGHKDKLPFLKNDALTNLRIMEAKNIMKEVNAVEISYIKKSIAWSPTSSFLYTMFEKGQFSELEIPKNKILISTNRQTILQILQFMRNEEASELLLRTKMKAKGYGKELRVQFNNKKVQNVYWDLVGRNNAHGLKFNSYLLTDESKSKQETGTTLFSIQRLDIENACFVYEAEIDGIQEVAKATLNNPVYSIVEVKTYNHENTATEAFQQYEKMQDNMNGKGKRINATQMLGFRDQFVSKHPSFLKPLLQGELGNVDKYIYGFFMKREQITIREFPCHPGALLQHELEYLRDFVELLNQSSVCSIDDGLTWGDWQDWQIVKKKHSMELWNDKKMLAELEMWRQ